MSGTTLEQVMRLADHLSPADRVALMRHLQTTTSLPESQRITREMILAEHQRRVAAGAFTHPQSLANRYATPGFDLSDEELQAGIREFSSEWEQELDEFSGQD